MRPGKVSYMSPEQVRGEGADHRSDIFSLGIILYELTVGRRLWRGPPEVVMRRIVEELIPPPTYVRRDYPPALEMIVMKALERRPADRYQSAGELQNELNEFMEESGLKSGSRRLSQYIKELFAPEGSGVRNERAVESSPADERPAESVGGTDAEESEDLDFDRRAPLIMTVEARPAEEVANQKGRAPVPPMQPSQPSEERRPQRRVDAVSVSATPVAAHVAVDQPERAKVDLSAVADIRPGGSPGPPGRSPDAAIPVFPAVSPSGLPSDLIDRPTGTGVGGARLRWAILLLLTAAVVVVFLAAR
jgi:hypothetical protein